MDTPAVMTLVISIHAAQEGCDGILYNDDKQIVSFQSTQPKRAATSGYCGILTVNAISIHAAQEGCDGTIP